MLITTLIATILHMQAGFDLPEALLRGIVSALFVGALAVVLYLIIILIISIASNVGKK